MSIFDELNLSGRRLPVITASEAAECGLACIAMISRYHGHDVDLNGLRQRHALSLAGASLKSLMEITDQLGFSTRALRVELSALGKVRTPAILHWDLNHFVVLKSVGRKHITIHDPAIGLRAFTREEFSKHFTGVVLELARAETFEPISARAPMKLSMLWSRMTGWGSALFQVLILSVALADRGVRRAVADAACRRRSHRECRSRPADRDRPRLRRARHHPGLHRGAALLGACGCSAIC